MLLIFKKTISDLIISRYIQIYFESFFDLRLKKGGTCPESLVGPLSVSGNTLCEWEKNWDCLKGVRIPGLHCSIQVVVSRNLIRYRYMYMFSTIMLRPTK